MPKAAKNHADAGETALVGKALAKAADIVGKDLAGGAQPPVGNHRIDATVRVFGDLVVSERGGGERETVRIGVAHLLALAGRARGHKPIAALCEEAAEVCRRKADREKLDAEARELTEQLAVEAKKHKSLTETKPVAPSIVVTGKPGVEIVKGGVTETSQNA